jgi:hypothetical protein
MIDVSPFWMSRMANGFASFSTRATPGDPRIASGSSLHVMDYVVGIVAARVMRVRRDHTVGVGRGGSAEYPQRTVAGTPACRIC